MKIIAYLISGIGGGMVGGFAVHGGILGAIGALAGMTLVVVGTIIINENK